MKAALPRIIISGIVGGCLVGMLIGTYVVILTRDYVVRHDAYGYPSAYDETQSRYSQAVFVAFVSVFGAIGPVFASASFGPWIRHAVYGLVGGIAFVIFGALSSAALTNEQPFIRYHGAPSSSIDFARMYAVPVAIIIGPVIGLLVGRLSRSPLVVGPTVPAPAYTPKQATAVSCAVVTVSALWLGYCYWLGLPFHPWSTAAIVIVVIGTSSLYAGLDPLGRRLFHAVGSRWWQLVLACVALAAIVGPILGGPLPFWILNPVLTVGVGFACVLMFFGIRSIARLVAG